MPDNPFEDPRPLNQAPQMRYASGFTDRTLLIGDGSSVARAAPHSPFDDDMERVSSRAGSNDPHLEGLGLITGVGANGRRVSSGTGGRRSLETRSRQSSGPVGVALTSDLRMDAPYMHRPETSSARSSPSLYPPTLPPLPGDGSGSLVDIPLDTDISSPLPSPVSNGSAGRIASPTTRKPVPPHPDLLPSLASTPVSVLAPQAQWQPQPKAAPPVVPPRSPLRTNSMISARSASRSPPIAHVPMASIQTQFGSGELAAPPDKARTYEPLTPPSSFTNITPTNSQSGHEPPSPAASSLSSGSQGGAKQRETFYTRTEGQRQQVRSGSACCEL